MTIDLGGLMMRNLATLPGLRTLRSSRFRTVVVVVLLIEALLSFALDFWVAVHSWATTSDFRVEVTAGRLLLSGQSVYAPLPPAPPDVVLVDPSHILYPPSYFVLLWPVMVLPDAIGVALFAAVILGSLAALLIAVYCGIGRPSINELLLTVVLVLSWDPLRINIENGHVMLTVAALLALATLAVFRGRAVAGGIALGLAIMIKGTALPLVAFFLWRRGYRLLAFAAATCGFVFTATLVVGLGSRWLEWLKLVGAANRGSSMVINQSLNGFWLRWLAPQLSGQPIAPPPFGVSLLILLSDVGLVALVAVLVRGVSLPEPSRTWVQLSLILIALPLVQGYGLDDHFTPVCITIPVVLRLVKEGRLAALAIAGLAAAWALVVVHDQVVYRLARNMPSLDWMRQPATLAISSVLLYAMLLALLSLGLGARSPRAAEPRPSSRHTLPSGVG